MVRQHYLDIRQHSKYAHCHVRVEIEANMSFIDADRITKWLSEPQFGSIQVVSRDPRGLGRPGHWTTEHTKRCWVEELKKFVELYTFCDSSYWIGRKREENQAELLQQLAHFREEIIAPANDEGKALFYKRALTGKSPGRKDDIVCALGMGLYYMYKSQSDPLFLQMCERDGLAPA